MIQIHTPQQTHATVHVLADFADQAAQMLADAIVTAVRRQGRCRLGLAGGTTPIAVYERLRTLLPHEVYAQLWVTWTDERVLPVPNDVQPGQWERLDPESNLRAAYAAWLAHVPLPPSHVLPLAVSADAKRELVQFGRSFQASFAGDLDIALIGTGPDGHIASLFPGHPALDIDDIAVVVHDSPKPPAERITLTLAQIARAGQVVVLVTGSKKADVVARALAGDTSLPLGRLAAHKEAFWLLDRGAAEAIVAQALAEDRDGV